MAGILLMMAEMRLVPHALFACLLLTSAVARVADTGAQVQGRYGQPVFAKPEELASPILKNGTEIVFENNGWRIRCGLAKATDGETYVVREEWGRVDGSLIYAQQVEPMLSWMRPGCDWTNFPPGCAWTGSDGSLAVLKPDQRSFRFDLPQAFKQEGIEAPNAAAWAKDREQHAAAVAGMKEWERQHGRAWGTPVVPPQGLPSTGYSDHIERRRIASTDRTKDVAVPTPRTPERDTGKAIFGLMILLGAVAGGVTLVSKIKGAPRAQRPIRLFEGTPPPQETIQAPGKRTLDDLNWEEFELLIGEVYRRQGYKVELCAGMGGDGGIDLVLHKDGERTLVQCKKRMVGKVPQKDIRDFFGTLVHSGAAKGIFVTTSPFSRDSRDFATGKPIELVDGVALEQMLQEANYAAPGDLMDVTEWAPAFFATSRLTTPTCPFCKTEMVLRKTATPFWGCRSFPRCKGKRDHRMHAQTENFAEKARV